MDALFVYGDRVAQDREGCFYIGTAFSQEIFDRYLEYFDHLILVMRKSPVDPSDTGALRRMNRITSERIRVIYLPDTVGSVRQFLDPRIRREIRTVLERQITPDRAVILRLHSSYCYIAARICVKRGIPYLAEAVGCPWDSLTHHSLKGKVLAPSAAAQMRYCMRHAAYAIYVTKKFLQSRYPTNGVSAAVSDVELLPAEETTLTRRLDKIRELKAGQDRRLRIGTSGSVQVAYKGQRFVFEALADLKKRGICRYEYHLAGGGDDTELRNLADKLEIEDLVVFEGSLPHDRIYGWLDDLDLYIQPSEQEGLSRALIEAMSRALPAFASDVGGNRELVADPSCIHKCGAVQEIAEELATLTPERMADMAKQNFEIAKGYQKELLCKERGAILARFAEESAKHTDSSRAYIHNKT